MLRHAEKCLVEDTLSPWSSVRFSMLKDILRLDFNFYFTSCLYETDQKKKKKPWAVCQIVLERRSFVDHHVHVVPAPPCVKAVEESPLPRKRTLREEPSSSHWRRVD